jgi:sulfotransferase family protein
MNAESKSSIRVLYIVGAGRSGSTILENILGQVPGFFAGGELRYIWERNFADNRLCGCGKAFHDCECWSEIIRRGFGGFEKVDYEGMSRAFLRLTRTRHWPRLILGQYRQDTSPQMQDYLEQLQKLYRAIQDTTGCKVILDSSKFPSYALVLSRLPGVELSILHLVRDARAVAYSWRRRKAQPDSEKVRYMEQLSPSYSSLLWDTWNLAAQFSWGKQPNYMRVRYEDFVQQPKRTVSEIISFMGEPPVGLAFQDDHTALLQPNHTVSGNPVRFNSGAVRLQLDSEWETNMKRSSRLVVTALTWPLLVRYGYPL